MTLASAKHALDALMDEYSRQREAMYGQERALAELARENLTLLETLQRFRTKISQLKIENSALKCRNHAFESDR